jgi:hypothetical protein
VLSDHFQEHRLDVAGEAIDFSPTVCLRAAEFLAWSCWFLLNRGAAAAEVARRLSDLPPGRSPAEHLSADLLLRFGPQVHRRSRAANPQDPLSVRLEETLRRWPLSGVLADIDAVPLTPLEFGHPGLHLLYAERLAGRPRPAWVPEGTGLEHVELVFSERKLPMLTPERSPT